MQEGPESTLLQVAAHCDVILRLTPEAPLALTSIREMNQKFKMPVSPCSGVRTARSPIIECDGATYQVLAAV